MCTVYQQFRFITLLFFRNKTKNGNGKMSAILTTGKIFKIHAPAKNRRKYSCFSKRQGGKLYPDGRDFTGRF